MAFIKEPSQQFTGADSENQIKQKMEWSKQGHQLVPSSIENPDDKKTHSGGTELCVPVLSHP